jgi:shikimate dehydrogenase
MRLFGLIGYPLSHSFSAKYFAKKFEAESISDTDYQLFPLENISEVTSLIKLYPDLLGFNITIPYKVAILPFLDDITTSAKSVGAVNCVKVERDASGVKLTGHNTDIYGFRESLVPFLKPFHSNALVLGTGGAAKAVCYTLNELGIHYTLVSRSGKENSILEYYQLTNKIISDNHLIINTSPVGTFPDTDKCPDIPYQFLTSRHLLFDLVYNPAETKFLKLGLEAGATILNGSKMLELQAEKSWEIWNG